MIAKQHCTVASMVMALLISSLSAMQQQDLMPRFKPDQSAQNLVQLVGDAFCYTVKDWWDSKINPEAKSKVELYRAALNHQDDPQSMPLEITEVLINHQEVMQAVLVGAEKSMRPTCRNDFIAHFCYTAARTGNLDAVKFFIQRGAKIDAIKWGTLQDTPLQAAIQNGHEAVKEFLLKNGAREGHCPLS